MRAHVVVGCLVVLCVLGALAPAASFLETFDGGLANSWNAGIGLFPDEDIWTGYGGVSTPIGTVDYVERGPAGSFVTIDGAQSYRMTNTLDPLTRVGMVSDVVQSGVVGRVEARFNTLTQDSQHIDQLVDLWLINSEDSDSYVRVGLFGSNFSDDRGWSYSTSQDGSFFDSGVNYVNDTWYRLRIDAEASSVSVSLWDDAGTTELRRHDFTHALPVLGDTFRVGIGQFMGTTNGTPFIADSAVDWISADLKAATPLETAKWAIEDGGSGNRYAIVRTPDGITWSDAKAEAEKLGGHLATPTTTAENQFVFGLVDSAELWSVFDFGAVGPWIGGYQPNPTDVKNGWTWVTGEPFAFASWDTPQEPNNSSDGTGEFEAYMQFFSKNGSRSPLWNDAFNAPGPLTAMRAYVVELPTNGDLDESGKLDLADLDILTTNLGKARLDLNYDGAVDQGDLNYFVETLVGTKFGDANLDGKIDLADFGVVKDNFGKIDQSWSAGDFNGNQVVELADFGVLKDNFGFKKTASVVPEPATWVSLLSALLPIYFLSRRGRS